jgi:hypothetical protein
MKYENVLNKKLLDYLKKIKKSEEVINNEEKFFNKVKKLLEKKNKK